MHENATIDGTIDVSEHAKLRWLQRAGGSVGDAAAEIRERLADATPTTEQIDSGRGWRCGGVIIVTDTDANHVKTVLKDFEGGADR